MKFAKKNFEIGQQTKKLCSFEFLWDLEYFAEATAQHKTPILNTHKIKSLLPAVMKKTECAHPDYIKTLGKYQNCSGENKKSMT